tara:strand:- start:173 stop:391 length:219 start_codon:yes stop_codon:yes gene_type:complete
MVSPLWILTFFLMKSAPMVALWLRHGFLYWYDSMMLLLPTPESPITTILRNYVFLEPEAELCKTFVSKVFLP